MAAVMSVEPEYEWPRPPQGGYTADDLDRLPNLPPHTELIDGSLVFASPQAYFHMRAIRVLEKHSLRCAPPEVEVIREMTVTLGRANRPEPDIMLVHAEAVTGPAQTSYRPEDVILAAEVVSPDSVDRDRDTKHRKYAAAGIRHFWRVENDGGHAVVYTFELEPATLTYAPTGVYHDELKVSVPFPVDIDLSEVRAPNS
ncbi:Uma2 family endonuclease [Streptomyces bathyalis]|uniref:Uma2 family endonuclease n=1 Tax=Streptomyces bathyalis TaxID=2710756 RepID=A0A7T1WTG8_9ACTN|nr:Uma2 family endonuclease [Streptomyces bathyalis]QPP08172.1 Uma2 family endonuclease [Streptomyces bathyalis]